MVVFSSGQTADQLNKIQTIDVESRFSGWLGVFINGMVVDMAEETYPSLGDLTDCKLYCYFYFSPQTIRTRSSESKYAARTRPYASGRSKCSGRFRENVWLTAVSTVIPPYNTGSARTKR